MTPRALSFLVQSIALLILLAFFPDAKAQTTPKCFINGGTERAGCFPAKMIFTTYSGILPSSPSFDSFESAKASLYQATRNGYFCNNYMGNGTCKGILTESIDWYGTTSSGWPCGNYSISPYVQSDPLGLLAGWNTYGYAKFPDQPWEEEATHKNGRRSTF